MFWNACSGKRLQDAMPWIEAQRMKRLRKLINVLDFFFYSLQQKMRKTQQKNVHVSRHSGARHREVPLDLMNGVHFSQVWSCICASGKVKMKYFHINPKLCLWEKNAKFLHFNCFTLLRLEWIHCSSKSMTSPKGYIFWSDIWAPGVKNKMPILIF